MVSYFSSCVSCLWVSFTPSATQCQISALQQFLSQLYLPYTQAHLKMIWIELFGIGVLCSYNTYTAAFGSWFVGPICLAGLFCKKKFWSDTENAKNANHSVPLYALWKRPPKRFFALSECFLVRCMTFIKCSGNISLAFLQIISWQLCFTHSFSSRNIHDVCKCNET